VLARKAQANIKRGLQERSFAIIADRTCTTRKIILGLTFWIALWKFETVKVQTLFQRDTSDFKEITMLPIRDISGQVTATLLYGAGYRDPRE